MSNEIALNIDSSYAELAKLTGQDTGQAQNFLPRLSINHNHENDEGKPVPAGSYRLSGYDGKTIYGKTAVFRPYINAYQYAQYDGINNKFLNKTIIFKNFQDQAIDELGGERCGKTVGKAAKERMTDAQKTAEKGIKCYRFVYGTISINGVDDDANPVSVSDVPVLWRATGDAFMPIGDALTAITKGQRPFFTATLELDKPERKKNGNTIYYVPVLKPVTTPVKQISENDIELLKKFQETINFENEQVSLKHYAAKAKMKVEHEDVIEEINEAGFVNINDFPNDELPASMQ